MRTEEASPIRLADYQPPDFLVPTTMLDISLHHGATRVVTTLTLERNPKGKPNAPLILDGDDLTFVRAHLNGAELDDVAFEVGPAQFKLLAPPAQRFTLAIETRVNPEANTQLSGLYRSSSVFCTQCEAQGFRRIAYSLDRPDILSVYTTRMEAVMSDAPILLSNGNPIEQGSLSGGRHYAVWHDPFPKPSYLFALVAGKLDKLSDRFMTRSGRDVELNIFVEPGKTSRAGFALDSLKRAMRWDEDVFGCEYDLNVFNIVAVSDFNMGAMENKGLNIFNDKYILAEPDTATDNDYAAIEAIVAHEYFHNWTGNRITCRDWFQLCLKEGLTVYRDQEFSSDMRSRAVKRIADSRLLKSHQFAEDSGPLAHPVRPEQYNEINNLYTATVYEKGAEIIRALKSVLGAEIFRDGLALYFKRHDGDAATVEDFLACFSEIAGRDLTQFALWYQQSGTPEIKVDVIHDARAATVTIDLLQSLPPTPGQPTKKPMVIPLAFGLLDEHGAERPLLTEDGERLSGLVVLDSLRKVITLTGHKTRPVLSINRGFSAPVKIEAMASEADLAFLAAHDSDPYARWNAVQELATRWLVAAARAIGEPVARPTTLASAVQGYLDGALDDPAFLAQLLAMPSEADIARELGGDVDPDTVLTARRNLKSEIGTIVAPRASDMLSKLATPGPYSQDAKSAGKRALAAQVLDLWAATGDASALAFCENIHRDADNMTERFAALSILAQHSGDRREKALTAFRRRHSGEPLILDKWFALQAAMPERETLDRVRSLTHDPAFSWSNPNRLRALIGAFATQNPTQFNRPDGAGHNFLADVVLATDAINSQVAARLLSAFRSWRVLEPKRRQSAKTALDRVAANSDLSPDVRDIVTRMLV